MTQEWYGGVLVVGSLYWDDDDTRMRWREEWLELEQARRVAAPIRYGRLSKSRGCTYTIVFSRLCLRPSYDGGVGLAVPLKRPVGDTNSLLQAAYALWGAEAKSPDAQEKVCASWGVIGLLVNPDRSGEELITGWSRAVRQQQTYRAPAHSKSEGPVIDSDSGQLLIPWPQTSSGCPLDLDFLLATATDPELLVSPQRYPSAERIAAAWIGDRNQEVEYFRKNRRAGIRTFQDARIRRYLLEAGIDSV